MWFVDTSDAFFNRAGPRENALESSTCGHCPTTGMPTVGIVAHFQRNQVGFPEAPAPVNREGFATGTEQLGARESTVASRPKRALAPLGFPGCTWKQLGEGPPPSSARSDIVCLEALRAAFPKWLRLGLAVLVPYCLPSYLPKATVSCP